MISEDFSKKGDLKTIKVKLPQISNPDGKELKITIEKFDFIAFDNI